MITFLFIAVVWLADGSVDASVAMPFVSMKACEAQAAKFEDNLSTINSGSAPGLQATFHDECRPVLNDSVSVSG